jgi:hypothetical protein
MAQNVSNTVPESSCLQNECVTSQTIAQAWIHVQVTHATALTRKFKNKHLQVWVSHIANMMMMMMMMMNYHSLFSND